MAKNSGLMQAIYIKKNTAENSIKISFNLDCNLLVY